MPPDYWRSSTMRRFWSFSVAARPNNDEAANWGGTTMALGSQIITCRPGVPHDGLALLAVHTRAIEMIAVKDYGPDIARSWAHGLTPDGYARAMADGEIFEVATVDGAIIGFCSIKLGKICGLYVDPDHMRRGVATQLLSHALAWMDAQGCEQVKIEASLTALPLYLRHGFRNVATKLKGTRGGLDMIAVDMER